jgi:hypothetical protein
MPTVMLQYEITTKGEGLVQTLVDRSTTALQRLEGQAKTSAQAVAATMASVQRSMTSGPYGASSGAGGYFSESTIMDPAPIAKATAAVVAHKQTLQEALGSIARTAHLTVNPYKQAAAQVRQDASATARMVSTEMVSGVLGPMSMAMGQSNPLVTQLALGTMRLQGGLAGASLATKGLVGGLIAIGAFAASSLMRLEELEKSAQRFAAIRQLSVSLDAGSITQGLGEIARNEEARARRVENSWLGRTMEFWGDVGRRAVRLPTAAAQDAAAKWELERALTRSVEHQGEVSASQTRGQLAQAASGRLQATLSDRISRGLAGPDEIQGVGYQMHTALMRSVNEKLLQSELQETEERRKAAANKTEGIEGPLIQQRAAERKALILDEERTTQEALARTIRDAQQKRAREELETQTAIAKETLERRRAGLEQVAQMEAALREAASATAIAELTGSEAERATRTQAIEYQSLQASLAATQTVNAAKLADQERFTTQQTAALQGMLAQGYLSEREYATQVRALDQETHSLKAANLQAYGAALTSALSKATSDYQRYGDQVRQLDRQMRETTSGTADLVAQIRQAGMSPAAALADRERRAHEHLREAVSLSGEEQVAALKAAQQAFGALALEAAKAGQAATDAGKATADAFDISPSAWRSTQSGQWSQAFKAAWETQPGGIGSKEWWALGFSGSTGQIGQAAAAAERLDVRSLTRQVEDVGKKILQAQQEQRDAAQASAASAKGMVEGLTQAVAATRTMGGQLATAATEAQRLADALSRAQAPSAPSAPATPANPQKEVWDTGSNDLGSWDTTVDTSAPGYVPGVTGVTTIVPGGGDGGAGGGEGYADGGYIPGPIGAPQMVRAHAGELIANPEQQARILEAVMRGRQLFAGPGAAQPAVIVLQVGSAELVRALVPDLRRAQRDGAL